MEEFLTLQCPHCWQNIEIAVDVLVRDQEFVQDCGVCCNPLQVRCRTDGQRVVEHSVEAAQ